MARHILMVGRSVANRRNLEADLLAMYDDIVVSEVNTVPQAESALAKNAIHLVVYVLEKNDDDGLAFCFKMASASPADLPPCLVLVNDHDLAEVVSQQGIDDVLVIPYSADELAVIINRICNPVGLRQSKRHSIPHTTATIRQRNLRMKAVVLNVSSGGVLCEFIPDYLFKIADPVMIDLQFVNDNQIRDAKKIHASSSNMKVIERNADYTHLKIRTGFKFITVPTEALDVLRAAFMQIES